MTSGGGMGGEADTVYIDLAARMEGFDQQLAELESRIKDSGDKAGKGFGGAMSAGLAVAATGAVALAGSLAAVAASSFNLANESAQSVNQLQAQLGVTRTEAEALGNVALEVFANNFGGSLTEAAEMVKNVKQEIKGLADDELQAVTEGSAAIADVFEEDQQRVAAAISSVMQATGGNATEAMDLITAGFQRGLDSSGDFLDTLMEYGPQFEQSQIPAVELFSLLETGAGKGAIGIDKAADTYKEFGLTIGNITKDSAAAYDSLGLSQEKLVQELNNGTKTQAEAFKEVISAIQGVEGAAEKTQIIGSIFAGAGEDMGALIDNLNLGTAKLEEMEGATDSLNVQYSDLGSFMEGMWRQVQKALLPVGQELLALANEAVPYIQQAFETLGPQLSDSLSTGIAAAREIGPVLVEGFQSAQALYERVGPQIANAISVGTEAAQQFGAVAVNTYSTVKPAIQGVWEFSKNLTAAFIENKETIIPLAAGLSAGATAFGVYRTAIIAATAIKAAWTAATTVATAASVAFRAAITFLTGPVGIAITIITSLVAVGVMLYRNWDTLAPAARKAWNQVRTTIENAMTAVVAYLRGLPAKMLQIGADIAQGVVNGIKSRVANVGAAAREMGRAAWNGIKKLLRIQSPSRVMHELGEFVGEGFVNGIASKNDKAKQAAQDMARAFTDSLSELKMQQDLGLVDLDTYIQTLQKAEKQLRNKLGAVKEGTPAYREYLTTLSSVTRELESATGKSANLAKEASEAAQKIKEAQEKIREGEAFQGFKAGLKDYSGADLDTAKREAFDAGDAARYNAVVAEQERRVKAVKDELEAVAKAQAKIDETEAFATWRAGLSELDAAALDAAKQTAYLNGKTDEYNALAAEQARRGKAAAAGITTLADALVAAGEPVNALGQLRDALAGVDETTTAGAATAEVLRGEIDKLEGSLTKYLAKLEGDAAVKEFTDSLSGLTSAQMETLAASELAAGNHVKHALAMKEAADQRKLEEASIKAMGDAQREIVKLMGGEELPAYAQRALALEEMAEQDAENAASLNALAAALRAAGEAAEERAALDTVAEGQEALAEATAKLNGEMVEGERPYARQLERLRELRDGSDETVEGLDELIAAFEALQAKAEAADGLEAVAQAERELAEAQAKLNGVVLESDRPFGKQIKQLEEMRKAPDAATEEIDELLAAYREMQAEAEKENKLVGQINKWADYAQQAVPLVAAGMEAIGGMSSETADAWAKDMTSMVNDLTTFATAIAKGDWVGAAVQALSTVLNWWNRNKRAAEEARKAAADYNEQFRFSNNGYGTREVTTYTTGILLWKTTHYEEHVDEVGKALALSLESGFVNGMQNGFMEAIRANDFSVFEKSLTESVGEAVLNGLVEAFMNNAILAQRIGPAIEQYMQDGNAAALQGAIRGAMDEAEIFYNDVLKPIAAEFGLLGSGAEQEPTATQQEQVNRLAETKPREVTVRLPEVAASLNFDVLGTLASTVERTAPMYLEGGRAVMEGGGLIVAAASRFERLLANAETRPNGRWNL